MPYRCTFKEQMDSLFKGLDKPAWLAAIAKKVDQIADDGVPDRKLIQGLTTGLASIQGGNPDSQHPAQYLVQHLGCVLLEAQRARLLGTKDQLQRLTQYVIDFRDTKRGWSLYEGMRTLRLRGLLNHRTLEFLLGTEKPRMEAILLTRENQNSLALAAGHDGVISKDIVELVFQASEMGSTSREDAPVLMREAVLEHLKQRSAPQTAEAYRRCKTELNELLISDAGIPELTRQAIKDRLGRQDGMVAQFPQLYGGLEGQIRLNALVDDMKFVPMIDSKSLTRNMLQDQLTAIQVRLEGSEGARLDKVERETLPTCQAFSEVAQALIGEIKKTTLPNNLQKGADALIRVINAEIDIVQPKDGSGPYRPSEQMRSQRASIEATLRQLSANTSDKSALRTLLEKIMAFLRRIFFLKPEPKKRDLVESTSKFFSCFSGHAPPACGQATDAQLSIPQP